MSQFFLILDLFVLKRLIFSQRSISRSLTSPKSINMSPSATDYWMKQNFGEKEAGLFSVRAVPLLA